MLGIVRGHSGALKVYSELGRGTTFKLLLPRVEGPADSMLETTAGAAAAWRGSGTMLIVDDEETVRATTRRDMVERLGFDVLVARPRMVYEALEIFHRDGGKIAGVLLDLTMPQLDGNATFTELRRLDPEIRVLYPRAASTNRMPFTALLKAKASRALSRSPSSSKPSLKGSRPLSPRLKSAPSPDGAATGPGSADVSPDRRQRWPCSCRFPGSKAKTIGPTLFGPFRAYSAVAVAPWDRSACYCFRRRWCFCPSSLSALV